MFAFVKLAALVGLASSVLAAPVDTTPAGTNELATRAPYDVHNGWVSEQPHIQYHSSISDRALDCVYTGFLL